MCVYNYLKIWHVRLLRVSGLIYAIFRFLHFDDQRVYYLMYFARDFRHCTHKDQTRTVALPFEYLDSELCIAFPCVMHPSYARYGTIDV